MKRSFSTLACLELGLPEVAACARRNGMTGVELRLDREQKICGLGIGEADAIRETLGGLTITDLASGVSADAYRAEQLEVGKQCVELARAVGCRAVRVFVGGSTPRHSQPPKQDEEGIVRFLRELCAHAAERNTEIWAETHSSYSSGKAMAALVERVGADNLNVIWDVIHSLEYRETPAETASLLGNRIAHVHLKDGQCLDPDLTQFRHTALGEGELPLAESLRCLREVGFDGFLSLEWELPWRPELKDCYPGIDETLAAYNRWLNEVGA